jgi:hypothetical protein
MPASRRTRHTVEDDTPTVPAIRTGEIPQVVLNRMISVSISASTRFGLENGRDDLSKNQLVPPERARANHR